MRLQARENLGRFKGNMDCLMQTVRTEGVFGLFTGLHHTVWRNSVWNGVYFGSMHIIRGNFLVAEGGDHSTVSTLIAGFGAGLLATMVNAPFDVVKSRSQARMGSAPIGTFHMLQVSAALELCDCSLVTGTDI